MQLSAQDIMTLRQVVLFYCVGIPRAFSPRGDYRVGMTVPIPKDTKSTTIPKRQEYYRNPKAN